MATLLVFALAYVLGMFLGVFAAVVLYVESVRKWCISLALPSTIAYFMISVPLEIVYLCCMTKDGGKKIKHRPTWVIVDYFNMILTLIRGFVNFFMRTCYWLGFFLLYLQRLDQSILPKGWRFLDNANASYWAMLLMDHIFNNPVGFTFRNLILEEIKLQANADKAAIQNRKLRFQITLTAFLLQNPSLLKRTIHFIRLNRKRNEAFINRALQSQTDTSLTTMDADEFLERADSNYFSATNGDYLDEFQLNEFKEGVYPSPLLLTSRTNHFFLAFPRRVHLPE
jgi:hypothetical protein